MQCLFSQEGGLPKQPKQLPSEATNRARTCNSGAALQFLASTNICMYVHTVHFVVLDRPTLSSLASSPPTMAHAHLLHSTHTLAATATVFIAYQGDRQPHITTGEDMSPWATILVTQISRQANKQASVGMGCCMCYCYAVDFLSLLSLSLAAVLACFWHVSTVDSGVFLISLALCADAAIGNVQEKAMREHQSTNREVVSQREKKEGGG